MSDIEYQGKIKWFDAKKAYGFIKSDDGNEVFFHLTSIAGLAAEQLLPDFPITYTLSKGRTKKLEASRVSPAKFTDINDYADLLTAIMRRNTIDYNKALLEQLLDGLTEIKDETSYGLALKVLNYAKSINLSEAAKDRCFQIASDIYRFNFWFDGHAELCDLNFLKQKFEKSPPPFQKQIARRLSINSLRPITLPPKILFENIQSQLLKELATAKYHIRIAVAWFTHQLQFDALIDKLKENVHIDLVIINDYINNWEFGLPLEEFVKAGGRLYLTGPERIMHHKFCIIDDKILCNGSYNWTYYAEERNQENCMFFYNEDNLIKDFNDEFLRLIADTEPVTDIIPPPFPPERYDLFSRRAYQSIDLQYKAKGQPAGKKQQSLRLLQEALTLNPENLEAKILIDKLSPTSQDEATLKAKAVAQTTVNIQQQIEQIRQPVSHQSVNINNELSRSQILSPQHNIDAAIADLEAQLSVTESLQNSDYKGKRGKLRINLKWNSLDDLDLHVHLPDNQEIAFNNKKVDCQGLLGELDLDANAGAPYVTDPQENIFWENGLPVGLYKVSVVFYSKRELTRVPFVVSIVPQEGEATLLTSIIEFSENSRAIVQVAELDYKADSTLTITSLLRLQA